MPNLSFLNEHNLQDSLLLKLNYDLNQFLQHFLIVSTQNYVMKIEKSKNLSFTNC